MKDFFVPKDLLLFSSSMGMNLDFSVRGFSGGLSELVGLLSTEVMLAQPWTPAEIATALWLDAADTDTIILNGSTVSEWRDKSGYTRHAAQGTAGSQPTKGANIITFDGGDFLQFVGSGATDYALKFGTGSFAILAIVAPSVVNRAPQALFGARGYDTGWFFCLNNANPYMRLYNSAERWSPAPQTGATLSTGLQMLGATAPRGATGHIFRNGSAVQASSSVVGAQSMENSRFCRIGAYSDESNTAAGFWLGAMHEILIFPGTVSTENWQRAEGYLAHKWDSLLGVTTLVDALPTGHPYKSSSPMI